MRPMPKTETNPSQYIKKKKKDLIPTALGRQLLSLGDKSRWITVLMKKAGLLIK